MTGPLVPFREIVLKVHSRCDLACDHCYVYEHADQSWRTRPKTISDEAISWTARRLAEHAEKHGLPSISVILHGGEPLLAGPARLRRVCEELGSALDGVAELDLRIHTNGVQLGPRYLDLFDEFGVKVGISLDGDRVANDRHRRYADGRTSHPQVLKAVDLLRQERYRHLNLGLLCTVDVRNDPVAVFDALAELEPPLVDFLLPHATWDDPPLRPDRAATPYADWLLAVFDRWQERGRPIPVRFFSSILSSLTGGPSLTESLGLAPTDLVVVETDGKLEQVDSLKSAYEGAAATGFDVFTHSFDDVAAHPGVRARQLGLAGVSEECRGCPVVRSCGGGLYTHRYRSANDFDNPSVYCADLAALVRGVEDRTAQALGSPAVSDPAALDAEQRELTRTFLARLNAELAEPAGEPWASAWASLVELEASGAGAAELERVLAHPYTASWVRGTLADLYAGRGVEVSAEVARLSASVAAAALRAGLDAPVPVPFTDGRLHLPTLGTLRAAGPGERGEALLRALPGGCAARSGDAPERRVERFDADGAHWEAVRTVGGGGAPLLALDDLDPYRDCFGTAPAPRLAEDDVQRHARRFAEAWKLLHEAAPSLGAVMARSLAVLTPVLGPPADDAGPAHGALGIDGTGEARDVALGLLRGFRRAALRAREDVVDLYALDGAWEHRSPWRAEKVPFSVLLAETFERTATGLLDPRLMRGVPEALETLESAAELTVDGKQLLLALRKEADGQVATVSAGKSAAR
ncbi:radical SAM/SPASM protein FxsBH, inactivated beta-hydroxylase extension form [uncultured Streptomyces sp.]|uniref:radical SAM/SPASM protein FxsBH, inactivated beta-hydroxylase extension form n=1 Tax=uncultured Streptomyces sp. TaxID=174707 RepID=UPI0026325868|nr:radical SAM/SPASM protein FxsB, inactivated metallohydrolase extension form [uncultured Streptomyces sp.]